MGFKRYFTFILILVLAGCFAGRKNKDRGSNTEGQHAFGRSGEFDWQRFIDEEEDSSFRITKFEADISTRGENFDAETQNNKAIVVDFSAELEDRITREKLFDHEFRVSDSHGGRIYNIKVGEDNKISWTERIHFAALKPQANPVLVVRKIEAVGQGSSVGYVNAVFELNPWAYSDKALGKPFLNLTQRVEILKDRHKSFDPNLDPMKFLRDPPAKPLSLNIAFARFYINRAETNTIKNSISSEKPIKMYTLKSEGVREDLGENKYKDDFFIGRGVLINEQEPDYKERNNIIKEKVENPPVLGMKLKLGVNLKLQTEIINSAGKIIYRDINSGKFMVFAALVASNVGITNDKGGEEDVLIGINASPVVGEIKDQILNVEFDMVIGELSNRGDLDLVLKVLPLGEWDKENLEPFSVLYKLGPYNQLGGHKGEFRDVKSEKNFDYDKYVKKVKGFTERHKELLSNHGILNAAQNIIFDSMKIRFRAVKAGETATQRTVIFEVTSCPRDGLTGASFSEGRQFRILVSGLDPLRCNPEEHKDKDERDSECRFKRVPIEEIRQNQDQEYYEGDGIFKVRDTGCLSWVDEIAHKYYQRENLIERSYHIVEVVKDMGGEDVEDIGGVEDVEENKDEQRETFTLTGYFNPWDEKFGTIGVDERNLSDSFIKEIEDRVKYPSRFFVGDFSYMTLRFRYDIDENMNLTVKKTVLLNLYPFVKRYSNIINGINGNFPIRDGIYLLKVAYQKDYIDPGAKGIKLQPVKGSNFKSKIVVENGATGASRTEDPFMLDDLRRKTFVYTIKKLVRVENSRVISPVEFHINELRTLRVRSNLLLQLEPVNQYKLQIINLLETHITKNIGFKIGNLGKFRCLDPGALEEILKLFQKTIDEIALSIPDNVNYTSKASFKEVINSTPVEKALSNLTKHRLLKSEEEKFKLTSEYIEKLEEEFRSNKSPRQRADGLSPLINKLREFHNDAAAAPSVNEFENDDLYDYKHFITPLDDDHLEEDAEDPKHALGTDTKEVLDIAKKIGPFLKEVTSGENLQELLNNDFTINPAIARVSDLDYLIDRKAGIIRRTFVGPLTLLPLDNKNVMNATDALDYDDSSNDGIQNENFEKSYRDDINHDYKRNPRFGYQGHFKNCHVDDFIVNDQHEELIHDAWAECIKKGGLKEEDGEIRIPEDFACDYEKTDVYKEYLTKQTNEVWKEADKYNSSPFKRFARHKDENMLKNEGRCLYREVWFKKYFSQKIVQKAQTQFGNFLSHPLVTAKIVQPPIENSNIEPLDKKFEFEPFEISAINGDCIKEGKISEGCIKPTDRFDLSVSKISDILLDKNASVGDYFLYPRGDFFEEVDDTPYKPALIEFYKKYNKPELTRLRDLDYGYERGEASKELSKYIYKTLAGIAAPPLKYQAIEYDGKLRQIAPADFGGDVQGFLCNIMLPLADQTFHDRLRYYKSLNPKNEEDAKELEIFKKQGFDPNGDIFRIFKEIIRFDYNTFKRALHKCHEQANSTSVDIPLPFQLERKFKTLKLGRYFFRGGKAINFAIGQNVAISHNLSVSNKYTLDPINSVKDVIKNLLSDIGGAVLGRVTSVFFGAFKAHEYSQTEANASVDNEGLATNAYLSMQAAELDLELLEYRRCMLVRWNEDFLSDVLPDDTNIFIPKLNNIFICGNKENEPIAIRENYYYITQHFTEGDLLDTANLLNNPWLLILRGYRDMIAFVRALYPSSEFSNEENPPNVIKLIGHDFDRLLTPRKPIFIPASLDANNGRNTYEEELEPWLTMSEAYRNVTPSFPGLFTQLSNREVSLPTWPWTNQGQINEEDTEKCESAKKLNQDGDRDEEN